MRWASRGDIIILLVNGKNRRLQTSPPFSTVAVGAASCQVQEKSPPKSRDRARSIPALFDQQPVIDTSWEDIASPHFSSPRAQFSPGPPSSKDNTYNDDWLLLTSYWVIGANRRHLRSLEAYLNRSARHHHRSPILRISRLLHYTPSAHHIFLDLKSLP